MNKKKVVKKQKRLIAQKRWWLLGLLLVLVFGLSIRSVVHNHQQAQQAAREKAAFSVLEKDMTKVSVGIRERIGTPKQEKITPYCQRTNVKFGDGYLVCGVELSGNISASSIEEAKGLTLEILESFDNAGFRLQSVTHETTLNDKWSKNFYYSRGDGALLNSCSVDLRFLAHDPSRREGKPGEPQSDTLAYILRCSSETVEQYYPMR